MGKAKKSTDTNTDSSTDMESFYHVCRAVESAFEKEWERTDEEAKRIKLEREKRAIMGYPGEMEFYKERIKEILIGQKLTDSFYPEWFPNLHEAIFAELYGLSGLAPWAYDMSEKYRKSPSAKLIGDNLFCLIDGKEELQPQKIHKERRNKLKRTLLLSTPMERLEYGFHEIYLINGIRITIYSGHRTKENQDVMVFRKYILKNYDFKTLIKCKTVSKECVNVFRRMIEIGFNIIIVGRVRSGKTTFLQIWQSFENPKLEGVAIATDPETPWHRIMPDVPIMQLVADNEELEVISKSLLRGDNDYILLEEMRDAAAYKLAVDITSTGTVRSKATIHDSSGINVPYKMASKITEKYGGKMNPMIAQIYTNFDYAIELCQHPEDPARKVVRGILEYTYSIDKDCIDATYICKYDFQKDKWIWNQHMGKDKFERFYGREKELLELYSYLGTLMSFESADVEWTYRPAYYESGGCNG